MSVQQINKIREGEQYEIEQTRQSRRHVSRSEGKVKEVAGKLSDDPNLEAEGTGEKIAGKVQEKVGQVKKVLGQ
jgi:uncharacterized protein YjbJ (UPF0337 family)